MFLAKRRLARLFLLRQRGPQFSVPVYKSNSLLPDLEPARSAEHEIRRPGSSDAPASWGEGLNRQSLQSSPVTNHECRSFQADQSFFLQMT